jgi:hypothetical protein
MSTFSRTEPTEIISTGYAYTVHFKTTTELTRVFFETLTGNLHLVINKGSGHPDNCPPFKGDRLEIFVHADKQHNPDKRHNREVKFLEGFSPTEPLPVYPLEDSMIEFTFNGKVWVETNRVIEDRVMRTADLTTRKLANNTEAQ